MEVGSTIKPLLPKFVGTGFKIQSRETLNSASRRPAFSLLSQNPSSHTASLLTDDLPKLHSILQLLVHFSKTASSQMTSIDAMARSVLPISAETLVYFLELILSRRDRMMV